MPIFGSRSDGVSSVIVTVMTPGVESKPPAGTVTLPPWPTDPVSVSVFVT